ncbi:LUC7 related protein [Euphorbia peplus]|nr:LUC7 related protein [Euphorbia peplus]
MKMDMGPCPKTASLLSDKKISRALKRLEADDAKAAIAISVSEVTQNPEIIELSKKIKEKLKEADRHDLEGKTDYKIQTLEEVEKMRSERAEKQDAIGRGLSKAFLTQTSGDGSSTGTTNVDETQLFLDIEGVNKKQRV